MKLLKVGLVTGAGLLLIAVVGGLVLVSIASQTPRAFYLTRAGEALTRALTDATQPQPPPGFRVHRVGDLFPAMQVRTLDGETTTIAAQPGRKLLVNVWATWCAPCLAEMPELDRAAKEGLVEVVGLSMDEDPEEVRAFLQRRPVSYRIALNTQPEPQSALAALGGHQGQIPYSVLVDEEGRIIRTRLGVFEPRDLEGWLR